MSTGAPQKRAHGGKNDAWKKKKFSQYDLRGQKGILFTFANPSKTSQSVSDVMFILKKAAAELDALHESREDSKKLESTQEEQGGAYDPEAELAKELAELKKETARFVPYKDLCRCVGFVKFTRDTDSPSEFASHIFEQILLTKEAKSRFICSFLPIEYSTKPHIEEARQLAEELVKKYLSSPPPQWVDGQEKIQWSVQFTSRNNHEIKRHEGQDMVALLMNNDYYKVNIKDPEFAVIIENNPKFCGFSIVKNWNRYARYNLMRASEIDTEKPAQAKSESEPAVDTKEEERKTEVTEDTN